MATFAARRSALVRHLGMAGLVLAVLSLSLITAAVKSEPAGAGIFFNDVEYTYKEYWASHATFTAGCGEHAVSGSSWYVEPLNCAKSITLNIPDNVQGAIAAVLYVDLWRNGTARSARLNINNGPEIRPERGSQNSRDPYTTPIPLTQLRQGTNTISLQETTGAYHLHDLMVRVYYSPTQPLIAGPGSDVTPPSGSLDLISAGGTNRTPAEGGTLNVDNNQITLSAGANDAAYVEFHGYYDGFDEDNDGQTLDWHNFTRNNWGPGGTLAKATGATIGHIGTDSVAPYQVTWNLPEVKNQSGVKFKVRIVDNAGNVREAPGGVSAPFTLARSYLVENYTIPNFDDAGMFFNGTAPQLATRSITLPSDLSNVSRAYLLGNFWENPGISLNDNTYFRAFTNAEDTWQTSKRELAVNQLKPGVNTIRYSFVPPGFGQLIEKPGPMVVIHRTAPAGSPAITTQPVATVVSQGRQATFTATASGAPDLAYQWRKNEVAIPGATDLSFTTPPLQPADSGSAYSVVVTNGQGSATSSSAKATVLRTGVATGAWWNAGWDFRVPVTVSPGDTARTNKMVEVLLNFTELMRTAGSGGPSFDPNSVRVVEVDGSGNVIDAGVARQVDPAEGYNAATNAKANVIFLMTGTTNPETSRTYHIYFDKTSKNIPAPTVAPLVTVTDNVVDRGFPAYQFNGQGSTWVYHKEGGGFAKLLDAQGIDWIDWTSATGAAGDYRGVPNAVMPGNGGFFHPGRAGAGTSKIVSSGPLKITIETESSDKLWVARWEVYPTYATFSMVRAAKLFWFLYEAVPGGTLDFNGNDVVVRSDGVSVNMAGSWHTDLPGQEWAYVGDKAKGRSFYVAHHQDEGSVESYWLLQNQMPVLGFGRGGNALNESFLDPTVNGQPQTFTVGLVDSTDFSVAGNGIRAAYRPLVLQTGGAEFNGVFTGLRSDDFSSGSLNPMWTIYDPVGDTAVSTTGTDVQLAIPGVGTHDLWTGRNKAPRLLQTVSNGDVGIEAKFNSTPTQRFSGHGLVFQADANNLIRFGVENTGTTTRATATVMVNGQAQMLQAKYLESGVPQYLRVLRTGNSWVFGRSFDGINWINLPPVTFSLVVSAAGVYALSHGTPGPAYTASLDYIENYAQAPIVDDAPRMSNVIITPKAHRAVVSWTTNVPATTTVRHGSSALVTNTVEDATLTTNHQATVDFLACNTPYYLQPVTAAADGVTTEGTVTLFSTTTCTEAFSDDFSGPLADPRWMSADPLGDTLTTRTGTNALFSIPAGVDHNLYAGANRAPRLRQDGPEGDFSVEAKFDSVLTAGYQMQGIAVEQNTNSFLRVEIHHDGTGPKAYVVAVIDGVATTLLNPVTLPASTTHYVRLARVGNAWTVGHSVNGTTWNTVGTFNLSLRSTYLSPYIGTTSTGGASTPAFVGSIDYFFNTATPIVPEDGGAGPDTTPPVMSSIVATTNPANAQEATVTWTSNELASSRVEWGLTTAYSLPVVTDNTAVLTHSAKLAPISCGKTYNFRVVGNDAAANTGASINQTFVGPACPAGPVSDDFSSAALNQRWLVVDKVGDGTVTQSGGLLKLKVPAASRHDLAPTNSKALRVLEAITNTDLDVEVGFESVVNLPTQIQGLVFEADNGNLVRFDLSSTGTETKAFVGRLNGTGLAQLAYVTVPGSSASRLQVSRVGSVWTFGHSSDGTTYTTIYSGDLGTFAPSRVGPFAGNANAVLGSVPPHTAVVDYFFNSASPIVPEDGGFVGAPEFELYSGSSMTFGTVGLTQPDINILGRVIDPDGVSSLTYSINGGAPVAMGVGPDSRRLTTPGEFNAAIVATDLQAGLNTVTLRAVDAYSHTSSTTVEVTWTPGNTWPMPYNVDWSNTANLLDVVQPIDGKWAIEGDTVHNTEVGYDRILTLGDDTWKSFEVTVPITVNSVDPAGNAPPNGGPAIGFIPHWKGHIDAEFSQPHWGFAGQLGGCVWYRYKADGISERLEIRDSQAVLTAQDLSGKTLTAGVTYLFKMRAESTIGNGPLYQLKVWPASDPEPTRWDVISQLPPGGPDSGSLVLVAHYVDASFGDISVTKLTAAMPTISPAGGTFAGLSKVTLIAETPGSEIRYTLDGSAPGPDSTLYTEPFFLSQSAVVRSKAFKVGNEPSAERQATFTITAAPNRVTDSLRALYHFNEGAGTTAYDGSGVSPAANLRIESGSVSWLPSGALRLDSASVIRTAGDVGKISSAVAASGAYSFEAWVEPKDLLQGPSALVGIGPVSGTERNASLAQKGVDYRSVLRTGTTGLSGAAQSALAAAQQSLHHVVFTRDSSGNTKMWIDGVQVAGGTQRGVLTNWNTAFRLGVGGMPNGTESWLGDLYLVAVYSRPLTQNQVLQNFRAGPFPPVPNTAPVVAAGPAVSIPVGQNVLLGGTVSDDGFPKPPNATSVTWSKVSGPGTVTFASPNATVTQASFSAAGSYVLRLTASDGALSSSATVAVTVTAAITTVPNPVITPAAGTYYGSVAVTISNSLSGAEIRYTTDGSAVTGTSPLYTAPVTLTSSATVRAKAFKSGLTESSQVNAAYTIAAVPPRVTAGLVAFYDLEEGTGATIGDTSGVGTAVDLTVADPTRTSWVAGGLRFDQATVALTPGSGAKVTDAVKASGAMTVEAWITPANVTQSGPAMIVSMAGSSARNWALGQTGSSYSTKFRTSTTTADGEVATATLGVTATRQHVVYTRDAAGAVRVYLNGALVTSRTLTGNLSGWVSTQRLSFGADRDGTKPWLGTIYTVGIYSRALSAVEVSQNFAAGEA